MDLPWRGYPVHLTLTVRRFRCANSDCSRGTFTEATGEHRSKHARRTSAATETLADLARTDGGRAGRGWPDAADCRPASTPCSACGVEIVVRDRAEAYAEGAAQGAPDDRQVAERFHLSQNASAAMDELLRGRRRAVENAEDQGGAVGDRPDPTKPESHRQRERRERRERRVGRWRRVKELREKRQIITQIGRETGMDRRTIRNYSATPEEPRRQVKNPRPQGFSSPTLQPFQTYLQDRWEEGCANISQLFREIVERGYQGSRSLVNQALLPWRAPRSPKSSAKKRRLSVRWLCLRPPETLDPTEPQVLAQLLADDQDLAHGHDLLQRFRQALRDRDAEALRRWVTEAQSSDPRPFQALGHGLFGLVG